MELALKEDELFDRQAVISNADAIGRESIEKVLHILVESCVDESEQVRAHLEAGNASEARRIAHGISGAAGNCAATELQRAAREIEHAEKPDLKQADALQSAAERSVIWVREELPSLLRS